MERKEPTPETLKRALELVKDTEPTQAMLGALGLYCVDLDRELGQKPHPEDNRWAVEIEDETNIERGRE